jgi:drug/metabolite transporter (DMT)-like permease
MLAASALAGSGLMFARLASGGTNTVTLQLFRFGLVVALLLVYFRWRRVEWRQSAGRGGLLLGLGLVHGFSSYTYVGSLQYIPTALAVIIVYTYPPLVSLMAHLAGTERITWRRAGALGLSFIGLAVALELSLAGLNLTGVAMAAAASISFALVLVWSGQVMVKTPPTVVQFHIGLANLAALSLMAAVGQAVTLPATEVGWLGLAGMSTSFVLAFLAFGAGIYLIGPSLTAILNNLEPVVAVVLSIVVLHEPLGIWQLVGGGLVLAGVTLAR